MPIPQYSVNAKNDDAGLDAIKQDIGSLCREAKGPHNNRSDRDASDCHPINAITELAATLDAKVDVTGDTMTGDLTVPNLIATDQVSADRIHLDATPQAQTRVEGDMWWNEVDHTLNLQPDIAASTLQVGQENWLRVVNKTGVTLTNGQVVYVNDAQGNRPTVALADASATSTVACRTIGVVTDDVANNAEGYVVTFGLLRGFNTSGFSDGDELWVNPSTPGGLTNTKPESPAHIVRVGYALNSTVNGMLFISPLHHVGLHRQNAATKEPTGFESPELIAVSYDSADRTVTLTQTGGIPYWFRGERYLLESPWTSAAHTATDGSWFLMFGAGGTFSWAQTTWSFESNGPVCYVDYNNPTGTTFAVREVHGLMPWQTHQELHEQIGTYRRSGGTLTAGTYALNTNTNAAITPGFDEAAVADEDLPSTIPALTEGSYTHAYVAAGSVIAFRLGEAYLTRTTGTYPNWNNPATGAETEASNGDFLNVYQILIPVTSDAGSQTYRMIFLQPQAVFSSLSAAQAEDFRSLSLGSLTALAPEFCAFTKLTFSCAAANSTVGKVRLVAIAYLSGSRSSQAVSSAVTPASHTVLADRSAPDQHPASSITFTPAGTIAATNAQAAIEEASGDLTTHVGLTTTAHGGIVASTDPRLTDARPPLAHAASHASGGSDAVTLAQSQVTNLVSDLAAKAPLASPALTGNPTAPTPTTGDNDTSIATTAFVNAEIANDVPALATAAVATHVGQADPHTQYQKESEKGAANGYASLDASTLVPAAQLPSATTVAKGAVLLGGGTTNFLRADGTWAAPPSGVTDHGALTGLADDDHTQYHTDARGDARYAPVAHIGAGGAAHANATTSVAGFMTGADKTKLDGIATGAEVNVNADWNAVSGDAQILNKPTSLAPTAHASTHNAGGADALAIDAAAATGSLRTLGTAATAACAGNDSRLSDARTPSAHASTHNAGGSDAMAIDAAAATGSLRTLGTAATAACAGNDSRLSDARTPTSHTIESHTSSDVTTLNVDNTKHGLFPKLPSVSDGKYYGLKDGAVAEIVAGGSVTLASDREVNAAEPPASSDSRLRTPFSINYCKNPDGEVDSTPWAAYSDTPGVQPVDGTGGSPSVGRVRSTTDPLRGIASIYLYKSGGNEQGQGWSYDFTIDRADKNRSLTASFDCVLAAGTWATDGWSVWVYDVTNSRLCPISGKNTITTPGSGFSVQFATSDSTSYRLIIHVVTTSGNAYGLYIDNVYIGPAYLPSSPAMSDWQDGGAITVGATTTNPTKGTTVKDVVRWRRVGDSAEVEYEFDQTAAGAAGSGDYLFTLPAGMSFDTTKVTVTTAAQAEATKLMRGSGGVSTGTSRGGAAIVPYDATRFRVIGEVVPSDHLFVSSSFYHFNGAVKYHLMFTAAIAGWGGTTAVQPGSRYLWAQRFAANAVRVTTNPSKPGEYRSFTRSAASIAFTDAAPTIAPSVANGCLLYGGEPWGTADPAGEVSRYDIYIGPGKVVQVVPYATSGRSGAACIDIHENANNSWGLLTTYDPVLGILSLSKFLSATATTAQYAGRGWDFASLSNIYFDILVADDPVPVALAPAVHVEASSDAGQVVTFATTNLQYEDETVDTHGAWNGSLFTAPVGGTYLIEATFAPNGAVVLTPMIYVNGIGRAIGEIGSGVVDWPVQIVGAYSIAAGDTLSIRSNNSCTRSTAAAQNRVSITRIGDA